MSAPVSTNSSPAYGLSSALEESTAASSSEEETPSCSSTLHPKAEPLPPKAEPLPPDGAPYLEEETHYFFACQDPPFSCALRGAVLNALWQRAAHALQCCHPLISEHVVVNAEHGDFPETSLPTPAESSIALVAPNNTFLSLPLFPFLNRLFGIAEPLAPPLPTSDTLASFTDDAPFFIPGGMQESEDGKEAPQISRLERATGLLSTAQGKPRGLRQSRHCQNQFLSHERYKFHLQTSVVQALAKRHLYARFLSNPDIVEILHVRGFPIRGPAPFPPEESGHVIVKGPAGLPICQFRLAPFLEMAAKKLQDPPAEETGGYAASPSSPPEKECASTAEDSCGTLP